MPYRAVDINRATARATDDVVMIVVDPVLIAARRMGRLNAPYEAIFGQNAQGVVYRLARDRTDLSPHQVLDLVRRAVRAVGHRSQDSQTLSRHLDTAFTEQAGRVRTYFPEHKLDCCSDSGLCQVRGSRAGS